MFRIRVSFWSGLVLFISVIELGQTVYDIIPDDFSGFEACIDGRLVMYTGIKSGIACVQCEFPKGVEGAGRESQIIPGMIRQGSDIPESGGQSFGSSCRNVGMGSRIFRMIGCGKLSSPGGIANDIVDIRDRPDIQVNVFVMEHADHRFVQAYSGKGISAGGFIEPAV